MFETAVVNEPPVFEPLKFYCIKFQNHICFIVQNNKAIIAQNCSPELMILIVFSLSSM